jgi:predicted nucleotide-binding protein
MSILNSVNTSIFQKPDLPYLADALSNGLTQKELDKFELGLDTDTKGHPKDTRAAVIVKHIFEGPKPDEKFLRMLKYIYFEAPGGDRETKSPEYARLKEILDFRGVLQTGSGFQLRQKSETTSDSDSSIPAPVPVRVPSNGTQITEGNRVGVNTLEGELQNMTEAVAAVTGPANRKVFIVRGQDQRPVDVLERFLHFAGLEVMSWNDAEDLTGETQPDTYDVIVEAMKAAAAIIIILSPDDEARLKEEFAGTEQDFEGQPRQNVLLEAGMAFSMDRNRTILVESGSRRPISDIAGFNWVTMDGSWENRDKLIKRLQRAGAQVNLAHRDLNNHLAGPFRVT